MKTVQLFRHPYAIIISFFAIMISGQHLGGFYLLYILLALPHGSSHALLALFGVLLLLSVARKYAGITMPVIGNVLCILAVTLLVLSLFFFFYNDTHHYNYDTFKFWLSLVSLALFFFCSISSLVANFWVLIKRLNNTHASS